MKCNDVSLITLLVALMMTNDASAERISRPQYQQRVKAIDLRFLQDIEKCEALNWNANDICLAEAIAKRSIDKSELFANYKPNANSRYEASVISAEAQHSVATLKCQSDVFLSEYPTVNQNCVNSVNAEKQSALDEAKAQFNASSPNESLRIKPKKSNFPILDRDLTKNASKTRLI